MAMENGPVEDVFPIEHGDIPASHVSLLEGISWKIADQEINPVCLILGF